MTAVLFWSFVAFVAVVWILRKGIRRQRRRDGPPADRFIDGTLLVIVLGAALVLLYTLALSS